MSYLPTRALPSSYPSNVPNVANDGTASPYGQQDSLVITPTEHRAADLGAVFTFSNPTIGTFPSMGVATSGTASFVNTAALFTFNNTNAAGGKRMWLRHIRLTLGGTAPTGTVSWASAFVKDTVSRAPSAGNVAITPVNSLLTSKQSTGIAIQAFTGGAALTVPSPGANAVTAARVGIPTGLGVVGDSYLWSFGGLVDPTSGSSTTGGTRTSASAPGTFVGNGPAIILEPGEWLVCHMWWLTQAANAGSCEYDGSYIEF